jgi:hypothetical protein
MKQERKLTHALLYDYKSGKWSCKCGYVLGSGHNELYALCPIYQRRKPDEAYAEISRSSMTDEKPKRETCGAKRGVSQKALDLFQL